MEELLSQYNKENLCTDDYIFFIRGMYKGQYAKFHDWNNSDKTVFKCYLKDGNVTFQCPAAVIKIDNNLILDDNISGIISNEIKIMLETLRNTIIKKKLLYPLLPEESMLVC
ncbi:Hypothetical protein ORPV_282 [Orpheovirus IHUMI-LCC2]|uniref:Uncharacterized protein n=1 Tax=Orpheovirus IHUMI-LCC2 TaxID=2023057 RepID=A0A2I2L3S5_9VIRU|nr:Hypothetical protein ORPV_282 [Orpheovirus IHUMI-LCC2]SNW62186.1 Hypothetical protein ORPV_282 [Orpheovirus IHUMI-LCC2]